MAAPLTDALVTAVAQVRSFDIGGLENLPPVMSHGAAVGLWRLTIAATLTPPEFRALWGGEDKVGGGGVDRPALKKHLRDGDVAWHHPWRCELALTLARKLLTGPDRTSNLRMLCTQGEEFGLLQFDLERTENLDHEFFCDYKLIEEFSQLRQGRVAGRGGSAVWRARRKVAMKDVGAWLIDQDRDGELGVEPPGWNLTMPANWVTVNGAPSAAQEDDFVAGRVLRVRHKGASVLWPYERATASPVEGFGALLAGIPSSAVPEHAVELVLLNDEEVSDYVALLAPEAHNLGLIGQAECDELVRRAHEESLKRMASELVRAEGYCDNEELASLRALADPYEFERVVHRRRARRSFRISRPWWRWQVGNLTNALGQYKSDDARLTTLAAQWHRYRRRELEVAMENETRRTVGYGATDPDDLPDDWDGDLGSLIGSL